MNWPNFTKFRRKDINNMALMFYGCSSLKEINFSNFNTNNAINMFGMFAGCSGELKRKSKPKIKM